MSGISSTSFEGADPLDSTRGSDGNTPVEAAALRCQWCSLPLAAGVMRCPNCGSAGVPDPRLSPPDVETNVDRAAFDALTDGSAGLAVWQTEPLAPPPLDPTPSVARNQISWEEAERRQFNTIVIAAVAVLVCTFFGWLSGPLLTGVVENFTGTPVENASDLRPMGAIIGLITGFMIGGVAGVVIWSNR